MQACFALIDQMSMKHVFVCVNTCPRLLCNPVTKIQCECVWVLHRYSRWRVNCLSHWVTVWVCASVTQIQPLTVNCVSVTELQCCVRVLHRYSRWRLTVSLSLSYSVSVRVLHRYSRWRFTVSLSLRYSVSVCECYTDTAADG